MGGRFYGREHFGLILGEISNDLHATPNAMRLQHVVCLISLIEPSELAHRDR